MYIVWVLLVFTGVMILFLPGFLIPALFGPRAVVVTHFFIKCWSWIYSVLNFIPYDIRNRERIKRGASYIFVSNHTSFMDIPVLVVTIKGQFRALAKKELLKLPVFGWIAQVMCVVVDRSSNESRRKSIDNLKRILHMGISVLIFPEGTQNRTKDALQPFYDGAFRIAVETQEPIIPIIVLGAGKIMPPGRAFIQPGKITVFIGNEIPTTGLTLSDVKDLREKVFGVMSEMIESNA
ncbi:MAG TPA: lysophospholipid acyltransferase family protein [Cyclobacteriaceae bacterium]|nr:lysophospholipid acyltransferase family protein [Cyclobacteriaceae bacterium]